METYPSLSSMGVRNPDQISRFTVYEAEQTDHLRIVYKRQKGSWLPESRKYKYPRVKNTRLVPGGLRQTETVYERSPFLINAVAELDKIIGQGASIDENKRILAEEIVQLEEEVTERLAHIKSLVASIK